MSLNFVDYLPIGLPVSYLLFFLFFFFFLLWPFVSVSVFLFWMYLFRSVKTAHNPRRGPPAKLQMSIVGFPSAGVFIASVVGGGADVR